MKQVEKVVRKPVTTMEDCEALDTAEIIEGYNDGRENFPCGENRSRAYWHGWRNGRADAGHAEIDTAQRQLAHDYIKRTK